MIFRIIVISVMAFILILMGGTFLINIIASSNKKK